MSGPRQVPDIPIPPWRETFTPDRERYLRRRHNAAAELISLLDATNRCLESIDAQLWRGQITGADGGLASLRNLAPDFQYLLLDYSHLGQDLAAWCRRLLARADAMWSWELREQIWNNDVASVRALLQNYRYPELELALAACYAIQFGSCAEKYFLIKDRFTGMRSDYKPRTLASYILQRLEPYPLFYTIIYKRCTVDPGQFCTIIDDLMGELDATERQDLLVNKKQDGLPLVACAIANNAPSMITIRLLPDPIPKTWLEDTHPFGDALMDGPTFLLNLRGKMMAWGDVIQDPRFAAVNSALEAHKARHEAEEQARIEAVERQRVLRSMAGRFKDKLDTWRTIIANGDSRTACDALRPLIEIMNDAELGIIVKEKMGKNYTRVEFSTTLSQELVQFCPNAGCFLEIVKFCRELNLHLMLAKKPLLHSPQLLRTLLNSGNLELLKSMLQNTEVVSADKHLTLRHTLIELSEIPPVLAVVRLRKVDAALLQAVMVACTTDDLRPIDEPESRGSTVTPLSVALKQERWDLVDVLIEHSSQLTVSIDGREVSLLAKMLTRRSEEAQGAAFNLLQRAWEVHGRGSKELSAFVNAPAEDGSTPLSRAAEAGYMDLLHELLESGANPFATVMEKKKRTTTLHIALQKGDLFLVENLLSHVDASVRATQLSRITDSRRHTLLDLAVECRNADAVSLLFRFGATLLPFTSSSPLITVLKSQNNESIAVVKAILSFWTRRHTVSVLGPATRQHHPLLAKFMLTNEAVTLHPYQRDPEQRRMLWQEAVDSLKESPTLLNVLLEANRNGSEAATGVKVHAAFFYLTQTQMQGLIKAGVNLSIRHEGAKLHFWAVQAANVSVVGLLLDAPKAGLDIRDVDTEGNTLLHWAVLKTQPPEARDAIMEFLVEKYPELIFVVNSSNQTPREYAKSKRIKNLLLGWEERRAKEVAEQRLEAKAAKDWEELDGEGKRHLRTRGEEALSNVPAEPEEDIGDLTVLGPLDEPERFKRRRLTAMLKMVATSLEKPSTYEVPHAGAVASLQDGGERAADAAESCTALADNGTAAFGAVATAAAEATLPDQSNKVQGSPIEDEEVYSDLEEEAEAVDGGAAPGHHAKDAAAAAAAGAEEFAAVEDTNLGTALQGLPWELIVTRDSYLEWGGMDPSFRRMVLLKLREIGQGRWEAMGSCKRRMRDVPTELHLWRCKFTKGGRIVFDIAQDFSATKGEYTDLIRIWCITLDHKRYMAEVGKVVQSFAKSHRVTAALRLVPLAGGRSTLENGAGPRDKLEQRLPRVYRREGGDVQVQVAVAAAQAQQHIVHQYPPATVGQGSYTLLKFYDLTTELARAILTGLADVVDCPFRVSPEETRIIGTNPGCSIILAGRSGTGKTTCACFRLFARWLTAWRMDEAHNQVFVTASGTLRREVARSFAKMRRAVVAPDVADELEALAERPLTTFKGVPTEAFPLFLSQKTYLEALDGTLDQPFFPRREDGTILWERGGEGSDPDGMSREIDLSPESDDEGSEDFSDEEGFFDGDASNREEEEGARAGGDGEGPRQRRWHRQEITYVEFSAKWTQFAPQGLRKGDRVPPSLCWCEIVSYIKGSAEAVRSETGHLSLDQYLEIGRKRAPNFTSDLRREVYRVFEGYERYKKAHFRYDTADVVAHLSRRLLAEGGYHGTPLHSMYRDEVQDFMQGELLLDLRVSADPNALFYCGDTAQTVARGVGFRFTDIQTLFYEEGTAALAAQREVGEKARRARAALQAAVAGEEGDLAPAIAAPAAPAAVGVPALPQLPAGRVSGAPLVMPMVEHLAVNYRTHSGILDAAAATVELLRRYFPAHIDSMQREKAFFSGPVALLVCGGGAEDMARLLSWSDKNSSQVEFGAHQVVLVRNEDAKLTLPRELRGARPLTVPQAKGLEFDDVLLWNFFSDSVAKKEWRVLLNYLLELEEQGGRELVSEAEASAGVGRVGHDALRPLDHVDPNTIRSLCDELKHLYTALTRAKNFVAIVDCDAEARAPFYYFLARMGLGRVVTDVGEIDKSHLGLSKHESTAADWAQRGSALMELQLFEYAAMDFIKAQDPAMAQYCEARAAMASAVEIAEESPATARQLYLTAGLQLLDLAVNGRRPKELQEALKRRGQAEYTRRVWARHAAVALQRAGETAVAGGLLAKLGRFKPAFRMMMDAGDIEGAANCCSEAATHFLARGKTQQALSWAAEAFRQLKAAQQYSRCLELLETTDGLSDVLKRGVGGGSDPGEEVAYHLMMAAEASGDAKGALTASRYVRDPQVRLRLLRKAGMWEEAASVITDDAEAAEVLMKHVGYAKAAERLLGGVKEKGKATEKEAQLLCQCAIALHDTKLIKQAFDVLSSAGLKSRNAGHLAASLALQMAESLAGSENGMSAQPNGKGSDSVFLLPLANSIAAAMIGSLTKDISNWRDTRQRAAATDGNSWPGADACEELETMAQNAQRYISGPTGVKTHIRIGFALAQLALARWSAHGVSGPARLGLLRCAAFGERTRLLAPEAHRAELGLVLGFGMESAIISAKDLLQWLSLSSRSTHLGRRNAVPAVLEMLDDLQQEFAIYDVASDQTGSDRLFSVSNGVNGEEASVTWPAHDHRFVHAMGKMENAQDEATSAMLGLPFAPRNIPAVQSVSQTAAKMVLAFYLFDLILPMYLTVATEVPRLSSAAQPQVQIEMLNAFMGMLRSFYGLVDCISAAKGVLTWVETVVTSTQQIKNNVMEEGRWRAMMRIVFPPSGSSEENIEAVVSAFPRLLTSAKIDERRLINFASASLAGVWHTDAALETVRSPELIFTKWRIDTCLLPGNDARKRLTLRALQTAAGTVKTSRSPEINLLFEVTHKRLHPGELLYSALDSLRAGLSVKTINSLSNYLMVTIKPIMLSFHPLPAEHAVWLLEIGTTLASLGCMPPGESDAHVSYVLGNGILHKLPGLGNRSLRHHTQTFSTVPSDNLNGMLKRLGQAGYLIATYLGDTEIGPQLNGEEWAVIVRRMALCLGSLTASAVVNLASARPKLTIAAAGRLCLGLKEVEKIAAAALNNEKKKGDGSRQMVSVLEGVVKAISAMASAKKFEGVLPPLGSLARQHGVRLLQVGKGGDKQLEFDVFPAKGPLGDLARAKLRDTIPSLCEKSLKFGDALPMRTPVGTDVGTAASAPLQKATAVSGSGDQEEDEVHDEKETEAEAKAAAGLVIWQAWQRYRSVVQKKQAMQYLRRSTILRNWIHSAVARYREMKEAERQQEAARSVQQQLTQPAAALPSQDWPQVEAQVRQSSQMLFGRYVATKYQLETQHLGFCAVCRSGGMQPVPPAAWSRPSSGPQLQASVPNFVPHAYTLEHGVAVNAFYQHCGWYEQHAAPRMVECLVLSAKLHFVARYEEHRATANYHEDMLTAYSAPLWNLLNHVDLTREWGYSNVAGGHALACLERACGQVGMFLNSLSPIAGSNAYVALSPAPIATVGDGIDTISNGGGSGEVAVVGNRPYSGDSGSTAVNQSPGVLDLASDDEIDDAVEDLDEGFMDVKKGKKGRGKHGRKGGKGR